MATTPIYLDHAAATPVLPEVRAAMEPYYEELYYNPSATYNAGRSVKKALEQARTDVAGVLGTRPSEIIFTAGGTEANNLAIHGVMRHHPGSEIVVSAVEHDSVLHPAEQYRGAVVSVDAAGMVDVRDLETKISDSTVLVSVMYANNEVGTIQSVRRLVQLVADIRRQRRAAGNSMPLYVHTDAAQAGNYLDLHVARLGVDMMTLNGGKIYGPKQSGILFVGSHVRLDPIFQGGGQERGIRSGTENVAQAVGFAEALVRAQATRHEQATATATLQAEFVRLLSQAFPQAVFNGSTKHRLPNNVHFTLPGQDNERLIFALDKRGIMAAAGSACSASSEEPSHVLKAMGVSDEDAQASLRFTLGNTTTSEQLRRTVETLVDIVE